MSLLRNLLTTSFIEIVGVVVGLIALLILPKRSPIRSWLSSGSERFIYVGLAILFFAWLGIFIYNRANGS